MSLKIDKQEERDAEAQKKEKLDVVAAVSGVGATAKEPTSLPSDKPVSKGKRKRPPPPKYPPKPPKMSWITYMRLTRPRGAKIVEYYSSDEEAEDEIEAEKAARTPAVELRSDSEVGKVIGSEEAKSRD